jgi:hypothetical protein
VVYIYNPSHSEGGHRKKVVSDQLKKSVRPYLKNKLKAKVLEVWLKVLVVEYTLASKHEP